MFPCFVYVIYNKIKNYIYVGIAKDPDIRISQHSNGKSKTTRSYRPFKTLLIEKYPNRKEARKREKYLKSGCGKEYLKKLIK